MLRLCSSSKTRAKILESFNIDFIQSPVDVDEDSIETKDPKSFAYEASLLKFNEAIKNFNDDILLLVADSVVTSSNRLFRKAKTKEEARDMLLFMSGAKVSVYTSMICSFKKKTLFDISSTDYFFSKFDSTHLEEYLESKLWEGKAGAITVEDFCKPYIKESKGLESTAMGLSIEKVLAFYDL